MRSPHVQLIDAAGMVRFLSSAPAADLVADPVIHAVTNLGWVEITHEPGSVRLRMSPGVVAIPALSMARLILSAAGLPVSYLLAQRNGWRRVSHNCDYAVDWIDRLASARDSRGAFAVKPLTLDAIFRDRSLGLAAAWQRVKAAPSRVDLDTALAMVRSDATGRTGLVELTKNKRLIFRHIGFAVRHHTPDVRMAKIGREMTADTDYNAACMASIRNIGVTPQIADVHGMILNEGFDPVNLGHRILRVPMPGMKGSTFIKTVFEPRQSVAA